ncbi:MAG: hypothetical protein GY721_12635 [Deltaproteobacteria bacterium]|nr:hypothetical protein [Deltaproteobacteria bacterium]
MNIRGQNFSIYFVLLLLFQIIIPPESIGQESAIFMIIRDENGSAAVTMTQRQLDELAKQPDISLMETPKTASEAQIAIHVPSSLGGGFLIAEPEALAKGMNATGLSKRATAKNIMEAVAVEEDIRKEASHSGKLAQLIVQNGKEAAGVLLISAGLLSLILKSSETSTTIHH